MAHELSVIVKRDVLAVRMSVTMAATAVFDPRTTEALWEEMGLAKGDTVIGTYTLGLSKLRSGDPSEIVMLRPKAVTSALLRYVGMSAPSSGR